MPQGLAQLIGQLSTSGTRVADAMLQRQAFEQEKKASALRLENIRQEMQARQQRMQIDRLQESRAQQKFPHELRSAEVGADKAEFDFDLDRELRDAKVLEEQSNAAKAHYEANIAGKKDANYEADREFNQQKAQINDWSKLLNKRRQAYQAFTANPDDPLARKDYEDTEKRIQWHLRNNLTNEQDPYLKATQRDKLVAQWNELDEAHLQLNGMIKAIQADPSVAGAVGSMRAGLQTMAGIAYDVGNVTGTTDAIESSIQFFGGLNNMIEVDTMEGNLEPDALDYLQKQFFNPTVAEIPRFEIGVSYMIAKIWKTGTGDRVNADDIKNARRMVQITGAGQESTGVKYNLGKLQELIERYKLRLESRIYATKGNADILTSYVDKTGTLGDDIGRTSKVQQDPKVDAYIQNAIQLNGIEDPDAKRDFVNWLIEKGKVAPEYPIENLLR